MKKLLFILVLLLCFTTSVQASNTNVSATVTDSAGIPWANGTFTFTFVPSPRFQNGPYNVNGVPFNPLPVTGALNGSASFTVAVTDNNSIVPSGTQWTVTYCPQITAACQTSGPITITGASQNITANFTPNSLVVSPGANQTVYNRPPNL